MKLIIYFLYYLIQFTWGIVQNVFGLILYLKYAKNKHSLYHGAFVTYHTEKWGGISLGCFIVMTGNAGDIETSDIRIHEFGHTIQSLILGPFYLLVIGIPSFIWCNAKRYIRLRESGISYYSFYPERWANYLGQKVTGELMHTRH
ncbi:MAG: hypothetical protein LBE09_06805 [Christensenellaceae bacterium]|jgi:hypothetical protein|nr:hypothetical protein [Christensenellaceae bacterium]